MKGANASKMRKLIDKHCYQTPHISNFYETPEYSEELSSNNFENNNEKIIKWKPIFHLRNQSLADSNHSKQLIDNISDSPLDYEETLIKLFESDIKDAIRKRIEQAGKSSNQSISDAEMEPSIELSQETIKKQNGNSYQPENIENLTNFGATVQKKTQKGRIWK